MIVETSFGPVWVSEYWPYFRESRGRQLYKQRYAGRRRGQIADSAG